MRCVTLWEDRDCRGGSFPGVHSLKEDVSGSQPVFLSPKPRPHAYCQQHSESRCSVVWGGLGGSQGSSTVVCNHSVSVKAMPLWYSQVLLAIRHSYFLSYR